jgi:hypothetical protein
VRKKIIMRSTFLRTNVRKNVCAVVVSAGLLGACSSSTTAPTTTVSTVATTTTSTTVAATTTTIAPTTIAVTTPPETGPPGDPDLPLKKQIAERVIVIESAWMSCLMKPKECNLYTIFPVESAARDRRKKGIDFFISENVYTEQAVGKESYQNIISVDVSEDKKSANIVGCDWNSMIAYKISKVFVDGENGPEAKEEKSTFDANEVATNFMIKMILIDGVWHEKDFDGDGIIGENFCGPRKAFS